MNPLLEEWLKRLETTPEDHRVAGRLCIIKDGNPCYCAEGVGAQVLVDAGLAQWTNFIHSSTRFLAPIDTPIDNPQQAEGAFLGPWAWNLFGLTGSEEVAELPVERPSKYRSIDHFIWSLNDELREEESFRFSWKEIAALIREAVGGKHE